MADIAEFFCNEAVSEFILGTREGGRDSQEGGAFSKVFMVKLLVSLMLPPGFFKMY